jgi:hypothetical protein
VTLAAPGASRAADANGDPLIATAGDIACKPGSKVTNSACQQLATSNLILARSDVDRVLTLGDNQYDCGSLQEFRGSYDNSWGRFLDITYPVIGNHEYQSGTGCSTQAAGYFAYFGAAAQPNGASGYYAVDVAGQAPSLTRWRIVVLNGNCGKASCAAGSPQEKFLKSALAGAPSGSCVLAAWHQPRFSGQSATPVGAYKAFWNDLYAQHATLVLNGHTHYYQRWMPQDPGGAADSAGVTEIVVGSGGVGHGAAKVLSGNVVAYDRTHFGVLFLGLHAASYDWQFVGINGTAYDRGSAPCTPRP